MTSDQWEAVTVMLVWTVKAGVTLGLVCAVIAYAARGWWT